MTPTERRESLRARPPFDRMSETESDQVAAVMVPGHFEPGAVVRLAGDLPNSLLILGKEDWHDEHGPAPAILGVSSLLNGAPVTTTVRAGPAGATALILSKAHFLTILHACPAVLLALMSLADLPDEERGFR